MRFLIVASTLAFVAGVASPVTAAEERTWKSSDCVKVVWIDCEGCYRAGPTLTVNNADPNVSITGVMTNGWPGVCSEQEGACKPEEHCLFQMSFSVKNNYPPVPPVNVQHTAPGQLNIWGPGQGGFKFYTFTVKCKQNLNTSENVVIQVSTGTILRNWLCTCLMCLDND